MKILLSKKYYSAALLFALLFAGGIVFAQSNITFPVAELGNCGSKSECRAYCDVDGPFAEEMSDSERAERRAACSNFAANRGIKKPKHDSDKFDVVKEDGGPDGKCGKSDDPIGACREFCDSDKNIVACVAYAKKHNLFEGKELEEAEKVAEALERGVQLPAACKDSNSCKATCDDPQDLETARQCFAFAQNAGLLPPGFDKEKAEKFFQSFAEGKGPFKNFKEMRQCDKPQDRETVNKCADFAEQNGFITANEAKMMRATGGKGPGGCQGEECRTYCDSEEHQDECMKFAEEHDLMKPEDKERMQKGMEQLRESIENAPPEVQECLKSTIGEEKLNRLSSGEARPTRGIGEQMRTCFESFVSEHPPADMPRGQEGGNGEGERGMQQFRGEPGGCSSPEECKAFCESDPETCRDFRPGAGEGRDFGQERAIERRGFEDPGRPPCQPGEECLPLQGGRRTREGEPLFRSGRDEPMRWLESRGEYRGEDPLPGEFRQHSEREYREEYQKQFEAQFREQSEKKYQERREQMHQPLSAPPAGEAGDRQGGGEGTIAPMPPTLAPEVGMPPPPDSFRAEERMSSMPPPSETMMPSPNPIAPAPSGPSAPEQIAPPPPPTSMSKTRNAASAFAPLVLFFFGLPAQAGR